MTNKQQSESPMQDLPIYEESVKKSMVFGCVVALLFICLVACEKKSSDAVGGAAGDR